MAETRKDDGPAFYESFWADASYQLAYAFDSAVRDRFPAIEKVWGSLKAPIRVLDYGCGNGVLSYWMHSNGFGQQILGVDVSKTGVEHGQQVFSRPGLDFAHLDDLDVRRGGQDFDVVVSSHVLEHIPSPEMAVASLLPMGEWFVIEVPLEDCLWPSLASLLRGRKREDNPLGHVNFWSRSSFRRFLHDNGLLVLRDHQYASAPYSPYNSPLKRIIERMMLAIMGVRAYGLFMATHYIVLARRR